MEYNLQKTIETGMFGHRIPNSTYPRLTEYPAIDYVNPGLGQVSRLFSFYVPLYAESSSHQIKKTNNKETEEIEQQGMGDVEEIQKTVNEDDIVSNNKKRKLMDNGVYDSFMNPSFKTKKVFLKNEPQKPYTEKKEVLKTKKSMQHKFQFY
jgi:hypothetical protein